MKKMFGRAALVGLLALPFLFPVVSGCVTTEQGDGLKTIEDMSDLEFARLKTWSSLTVKLAAHQLVKAGTVDQADLDTAADVLDALQDTSAIGGSTALVQQLLADSGLTSVEIQSLVELVVFELEARGVLDKLADDGTIDLTPRTEELLDALTEALRGASAVTEEEEAEAEAFGIIG